ncbi:Coiledcoil domain containing protein [Acanthamoeba castellanii str. Neff]|uniref:Coiled-coil domain-containing protein 86 n=1 Tax=Acanthamoeba castellanii (strain ATCC 30010 / Neff) TaxID=1257118 RepID=L8H5Y8_ACACF|nr:Coiledcoil domain containing protein [Acanthamoeba castellanii str. Neff]ELR20143.1 Coiledcoil domain containing protein [Acanthamoeba castellanii str. Neff]
MGKAKKTTKETTEKTAVSVETAPAASEAGGDVAHKKNTIPVAKGVPKSGRVWKSTNNKRSSSLLVGKAYNKTWEAKSQEREKLKVLKAKERALKEDTQQKKEQEKKEAAERRKRKEENLKKSTVVQKITDTRKLKKMKRSQFKLLEKR